MYCEITVEHRQQINANGLRSLVTKSFGDPIALNVAYERSAIYHGRSDTRSICAIGSGSTCFVIVRKITMVRLSMYHLEGNDPRVPVPTLLQAVEDFSKELTTQLRRNTIGPAYQPRSLRVQLVEDNGKETGLIGEPQNDRHGLEGKVCVEGTPRPADSLRYRGFASVARLGRQALFGRSL
jgi:hypothetical protein